MVPKARPTVSGNATDEPFFMSVYIIYYYCENAMFGMLIGNDSYLAMLERGGVCFAIS